MGGGGEQVLGLGVGQVHAWLAHVGAGVVEVAVGAASHTLVPHHIEVVPIGAAYAGVLLLGGPHWVGLLGRALPQFPVPVAGLQLVVVVLQVGGGGLHELQVVQLLVYHVDLGLAHTLLCLLWLLLL